MNLSHVIILSDRSPETQEGWNFFKGSLEINNLDGSTSLFGGIKSTIEERVTLYDGYLNPHEPHFLVKDRRQSETKNHFLITLVSDSNIVLPKSFNKNSKNVKIHPTWKEDESMVLTTLFLHKDQIFTFRVKSPHGDKTRKFSIEFSTQLGKLLVEDITPIIKRPTITLRAVRFLKKVIYKRLGFFGHV